MRARRLSRTVRREPRRGMHYLDDVLCPWTSARDRRAWKRFFARYERAHKRER